MNNRGSIGLIVGIVVGLVLFAGGYMAVSTLLRPSPTGSSSTTFTTSPGDIDRSGTADEEDKRLFTGQEGCAKDQPCWNQTVGKTKDGDNPIYVSDLDLNADGTISNLDLEEVK